MATPFIFRIIAIKLIFMKDLQQQFNAIKAWESWDNNTFKFEQYSLDQYLIKRGVLEASSYLMGPNKRKKAIYFLYNRNGLVYIGKTERYNQYARPIEHIHDEKSPKIFDEIKMWMIPDNICVETLESILIFQNDPFYNKTNSWGGTPISKEELVQLIKQYKIKTNEEIK